MLGNMQLVQGQGFGQGLLREGSSGNAHATTRGGVFGRAGILRRNQKRSPSRRKDMSGMDLRPLSLGDILDRTVLVYRRRFLLFLGITAIPQLCVLAWNLAEIPFQTPASRNGFFLTNLPLTLFGVLISLIAYLFSQGGSV